VLLGVLKLVVESGRFIILSFVTPPSPYRTSPSFLGGQGPWQALQLSTLVIADTTLRWHSSVGRCFMGEHLPRSHDIVEPHPQMCFTFVMYMWQVGPWLHALKKRGHRKRDSRRELLTLTVLPIFLGNSVLPVLGNLTLPMFFGNSIRPIFFGISQDVPVLPSGSGVIRAESGV